MVAFGRWLLTRINSLGFSSEKGSRLIYFNMEHNLLHAISLLQYVQFHVVTQISLYALSGIVNRVSIDIRLKTVEKSKNVSPPKWSFTRVSNCKKGFDMEKLGVLDRWLRTRAGHPWRFVCINDTSLHDRPEFVWKRFPSDNIVNTTAFLLFNVFNMLWTLFPNKFPFFKVFFNDQGTWCFLPKYLLTALCLPSGNH